MLLKGVRERPESKARPEIPTSTCEFRAEKKNVDVRKPTDLCLDLKDRQDSLGHRDRQDHPDHQVEQ
jgi:hypothetical protein